MADTGSQEDTEISLGQRVLEAASMNEDIHHLGHTEGVAEIVEWIVSVVFLNTQQKPTSGLIVSSKTSWNLKDSGTASMWKCECPVPPPIPARDTFPPAAKAFHLAPTATRQTAGS